MTEKLWTTKDVAEYLGVSTKTALTLPLPVVRLGRRLRRYVPADVKAYCEKRGKRVAQQQGT